MEQRTVVAEDGQWAAAGGRVAAQSRELVLLIVLAVSAAWLIAVR